MAKPCFLTVAALALLPIAVLAQDQTSVFPLTEVKEGVDCYALTVQKGSKPTKIKLELVGNVAHPLFDGERAVLAEMQDGIPVVAGMSGSPVYCGKRLLGALAFEYGAFPLKKGLAGITPIRAMRDQRGTLGARKVAQANASALLPLAIRGALPKDLERINREKPFGENFVFVPAGGSTASASPVVGALSPGDSVTMYIARGAFEIGGTGTVTEASKKTFSAFGHPFFGEGPVAIPAYRTSVVKMFESSYYSYKLVGDALYPVGTVTYDNTFAVEGVREIMPDVMMPVIFKVAIDNERYEYNFEVFRHKVYGPLVVQIGTRQLLANIYSGMDRATARLEAKIFLKGRDEPLKMYATGLMGVQLMQFGPGSVFTDPFAILNRFQGLLQNVAQNEWGVVIDRLEIALDLWSGNRILRGESMSVLDAQDKPVEEVKPGDELRVLIGLRDESGQLMRATELKVKIPTGLNLVKPADIDTRYLPISLRLMSGGVYQEADPKKIPRGSPRSGEEFLKRLVGSQRDPSKIFAHLVLPPEHVPAAKKIAMPELHEGVWTDVESLEFLEEQVSSQPRVFSFDLGSPHPSALVYVQSTVTLKLIIRDE